MKGKITSLILASVLALGAMPIMVSAADDYATRGQVCDMLLIAADDYNPGVVKTDILRGYDDGELHEERSVTRAEALVMLKRAFGDIPEIKGANAYLAIPMEDFTDIPAWAETELDDVFASGIVAGKAEGIFAPDDNVTVDQMKLFIQRMYRVFSTNEKDDFYSAINKDNIDNAVIPAGQAVTGTWYDDIVDNQLIELMEEISKSNPDKNSKEGKIKTLYDNYLNKEARNEQGFDAIKPDFDEIDAVENISDFVGAELVNYMIEFDITIDEKDSNRYVNSFETISVNSKDMYEGRMENRKAAYLKYMKTLFMLAGYTEDDAAKAADDVFAFKAEIAKASLSIVDLYDVDKTYNEYSFDELKAVFTNIDLDKVFDNSGFKNKDRFIVTDVGAMNKVAEILTDDNIDIIKTFIKSELLQGYASYLSDDFTDAYNTYVAEASGVEGTMSDEYYAMDFVNSMLSTYVGEIYGDKYGDDQTKAEVIEMINEVIDVYRERITNLDWMSDITKEEALKKLDTMGMKVVAPDTWPEIALDSMEIRSYEDGGSLVENIKTIMEANEKDACALEGGEVDNSGWVMMPQIVNACYNYLSNDITIPAADLQIPVEYRKDAPYERNLAGVGFTIGHELSHAFDSSGSQYDENGNAVNWWTDEDAAAFDELCQRVVEFFDGQEAAPGIAVNGELTLGENIADIGALSVMTEVASKKEDFNYKEMYESYARYWFTVSTREYLEYITSNDVHSPGSIRINRVLQTVDKFYETFDITENDGMWVAPEDRVSIW